MNADRTSLTNAYWALLPGRARRRRVVTKDNRGSGEVVLRMGRTGLPWWDLPPHLGRWYRVLARFSRWSHRHPP